VIQSEIRFREGTGPPPVIPDPAVFKNSTVLFGFSAQGLMDLRPTPLSRVYGVATFVTLFSLTSGVLPGTWKEAGWRLAASG
jgi:adenylate cyclase